MINFDMNVLHFSLLLTGKPQMFWIRVSQYRKGNGVSASSKSYTDLRVHLAEKPKQGLIKT